MENKKRELIPAVWISVAVTFMLFVYAPIELYVSNYQDFSFDIYDVLKFMPGIALACFVVSVVIFFVCKKINKVFFRICLLAVSVAYIATFIQGTFFIKNLPLLDGTAVDWSEYDHQRLNMIFIWIILSALAIFCFNFMKEERILSAVSYIGGLSFLFLLVSLVLNVLSSPKALKEKNETCMTADSVMEMSQNGKNFVILLLDSVDGKSFHEIIEDNPEYKNVFENFTEFSNTMSGYPYTTRSVPFILFGKWYDNSTYYPYYIQDAVKESPFMNKLEKENFDKSVYFEYLQRANLDHNVFSNFKNVEKFNEPDKFVKMIIKLVGLKYLPYDLKQNCMLTSENIYYDTLKTNKNEKIDYYSFANQDIYDRFASATVKYADTNCFRFLYANGAHGPYEFDENMQLTENGDYFTSIKASIKIADTYLNKLKEADVYDNSVIVILADHGTNLEDPSLDTSKQNPFMLIKGIQEKHTFQTNDAPISHADLQEAFIRLLDGAHSEACFNWHEGDNRTRKYMQSGVVIESTIYEQTSNGHASEANALQDTGNVYEFDWACVDAREAEERAKG